MICHFVQAQTTEWTFNTNSGGWILAHSLTGSVGNGFYNLTINGSDPYMLSPDKLNIDATLLGHIKLRLQNLTTDNTYQLFWTTTTDNTWNQEKSVFFNVTSSDAQQSDYEISMLGKTNWAGTIKQLRLDLGNGDAVGHVIIDQINIEAMPEEFGLNNGVLHIMQDLNRGGAISYISKSSDYRNIVNVYDEGRYIQQSYYAGNSLNRQSEGQSSSWTPWPWNPIQVGDYSHKRAQILSSQKGINTLYVKCIPMLWDMSNRYAEAEMEQWTTLENNVIKVKCRLTCHRTDNLYGENILRDQELPAVYPISALSHLYSYFGDVPYTNAALNNPAVVNLSSGFWGTYNSVTENWMAFVDNNKWGMGIYNPSTTAFWAGMSGNAGFESSSASTCYIAPAKKAALMKNSLYEYEYYIIIGSLSEIRADIYDIHSAVTSNPPVKEENKMVDIYPNPANDKISVVVPIKSFIEIKNIQGQLVYTLTANKDKLNIDVSALQSGLYFLKAKSGNEILAGKFLKK